MGPGSDEVDELRQEIDQTRENLGSAVGALAYKADVKNRGKEVIEDNKEVVMQKVDELKTKVPGVANSDGADGPGMSEKVKDKLPDPQAVKDKLPDGQALKDKLPDGAPSTQDVKAKAQSAADAASHKPLAVAAGAAAVGLAAGLAIPETELERQQLAPHAQAARQQAEGKVHDTVAQVKSGAQDAASNVADAVKEKGQEQGGKIGEVAEKAADKTHEQVSTDISHQQWRRLHCARGAGGAADRRRSHDARRARLGRPDNARS